MPKIKCETPLLGPEGPRVQLTIARPEMLPIPEGQSPYLTGDVLALIDTGADYCGIRNSLADDMCLQEVDREWLGNSSGGHEHPIYIVDMIFPQDGKRRPIHVAGCNFSRSVEFLIGRHFLAHAAFEYHGPSNYFSLEFD